MIYIGDTDIWKRGRTIYEFQMTEIHVAFQIEDGLREIFVNTAINDGSAITELMQYFTTADPYDMTHGALSKQVNFYKVEQEGVRFMKSLSQQIYDEGRTEALANSVYALMQHQECDENTAMDILNIHQDNRYAIIELLKKIDII